MSKEKTLIIGGGQAACQTVTALKSKGYQGKIKIMFDFPLMWHLPVADFCSIFT